MTRTDPRMNECQDGLYKRTEAGVIPADWSERPLRALLLRGRLGGNYPSTGSVSSKPLIKMGNLARGHIDLSKIEYVPENVPVHPDHRLRRDDVLFNTRNTLDLVGKVSIWRGELPDAYYNSNLMRLEFDPRVLACNAYANYALNTRSSIERLRALATGTTSVAAIYTRDLLDFSLPVPGAAEQRAIADAISDAHLLVFQLDSLIQKRRDLKQAMMQQLVAGRTRLPGFHGRWAQRRMSELANMQSGGTPRSDVHAYYGGEIPWVSITDMTRSGKMLMHTERSLTPAGLSASAAQVFPPGTVLYAMYASIGECSIAGLPVSTSQAILGIRPGKELYAEYLYYWLSSRKAVVISLGQQGTQSNLSKGIVGSFLLPTPPLAEQIAIAEVLSDLDGEISRLEDQRQKAYALRRGMMQQLLTGRIRLI